MTSRIDPRTPILVGGGQFTQRTAREGRIEESRDPIGMLEEAARRALADTGAGAKALHALDTVAVVRFVADSSEAGRLPARMYRNPPWSLARKLGAAPRRHIYTSSGGNTPQWLVNRAAEEIANGEAEAVLLAGAEDLASMLGALKRGIDLNWGDGANPPPGDPIEIGEFRRSVTEHEKAHGLYFPVNIYPMFENAIRGAHGRDVRTHMARLGALFARFAAVAADNPDAWFPVARNAEEIATPGQNNRFVGYPYTKYMNAVIEVDMSAAVVMTSVAKARELDIPREKWVFLHGCADAADLWHVSERVNYHSSPAIRTMVRKAFAMAGLALGDIAFFDLYSCFPSAVEIGAQELGLAEDDPRGLTITGGLPYFGGPGNNYTMHAIVAAMKRARAEPASFGLVTGNGWYVTKHSLGIYSAKPVEGKWAREDPESYQRELDAMAHPAFTENPQGRGTVETYTVVTDRKGRRFGIVFGRLQDGTRFLANVPDAGGNLERMMSEEMLGRSGEVMPGETNTFRFA